MSEPIPGALADDGLDAIERLYRAASEFRRTIIARGLARRWEDERDGT